MPIKRLFLTFSMRRGGQHGIINWLLKHWNDDEWRHFNNRRPGRAVGRRKLDKNASVMLISFEDWDFRNLSCQPAELFKESGVDAVSNHMIFMHRDPFNMFASRSKIYKVDSLHRASVQSNTKMTPVDVWKVYAREALGETCYLPDKIVVSYNQWFSCKAYRQSVAEQFGLTLNDRGMKDVTNWGQGSSFDKRKFDGKADQMQVMSRWCGFLNDDGFVKAFDEEVLTMASRLYLDGFKVSVPSSVTAHRELVEQMAFEVESKYPPWTALSSAE